MKKSSFVALILGTISGVLFSLGMCMALLPEWNAFSQGVGFGIAGMVFAVLAVGEKLFEKSFPPNPLSKTFIRKAVSALRTDTALAR